MVMPPTENRSIVVMPVGIAAARTQSPMPTQKLAAKRSCMRIKNVVVCAASRAHLASLARPCPVGSKKRSSTSTFSHHPARPGPSRSHCHDAGTGRTVVICAQKTPQLLDLDSSLSQDASVGELCVWRSEQTYVSTLVDGYSSDLSCWSLFH